MILIEYNLLLLVVYGSCFSACIAIGCWPGASVEVWRSADKSESEEDNEKCSSNIYGGKSVFARL